MSNNRKILTFSSCSNDFENTAQKVAKAAISNIKTEDAILIKVPEPKSPFWYRDDDLLDRVQQIIRKINPKVYVRLYYWFSVSEYCFQVWKDFDAFMDFSGYTEGQLLLRSIKYANDYENDDKFEDKLLKVSSLKDALEKACQYELSGVIDGEILYCFDFSLYKVKNDKLEPAIDEFFRRRFYNAFSFVDVLEYYKNDVYEDLDTSGYYLD